jgi:hypothetical protein
MELKSAWPICLRGQRREEQHAEDQAESVGAHLEAPEAEQGEVDEAGDDQQQIDGEDGAHQDDSSQV